MWELIMDEYSPQVYYGKISKRCSTQSPKKLTLSGNFSSEHKAFDILLPLRRAGTRQSILEAVMKKTESVMEDERDDNPMYEDPRDVIAKPSKPPRKRNIQAIAVTSPRPSKEHKSLLREQKRKLTKKYESLITTLMDRCEENLIMINDTKFKMTRFDKVTNYPLQFAVLSTYATLADFWLTHTTQVDHLEERRQQMISEKDSHITKLKEKLKTVLDYNKLFADENDQLRIQYETIVKYVDECKNVIREEREKNRVLESKRKDLEERVSKFEVPDRDEAPPPAIPLVEVCMSCSSRQIVLNQARDHNTRLQRDMQAMKDVLYRLNVQLSRYQEKLRSSIHNVTDGKGDSVYKPDGLDSLITTSLGYKETATEDVHSAKAGVEDHTQPARLVDLSGLLSAQALAPLFDAYQENLQEKDSLILDYEKQFENINKKSKQIVSENKTLTDRVNSLEEELARLRQSYKKSVVEKETTDIEKVTLVERAERAESKLKEVYELYEDKMAAMMRDYETVHREYFTVKNALEASEGKMAQLDMFRSRTVPADLHERRLDHCKRLLEELKHQYGMETGKKSEQLAKIQQQLSTTEEKYNNTCKEYENMKKELEAALKNVRLYRKAAVIFRQRLKAATARVTRVRSSVRRARNEPLKQALQALDKIKSEIKVVKSRAYSSLEELERRIVEQERRAAHAHQEYKRELERASIALEHKESIIRTLIDKVADVEEVRLSQTNIHRLQGIVSESSPEPTAVDKNVKNVKLVPGEGGYFQDRKGKDKAKGYTKEAS